MPLFEQVRVGVVAKEFNNVTILHLRVDCVWPKSFLEVFVGSPNLVASKVDSLVESIRTGHALEINSVKFTATVVGQSHLGFHPPFSALNFRARDALIGEGDVCETRPARQSLSVAGQRLPRIIRSPVTLNPMPSNASRVVSSSEVIGSLLKFERTETSTSWAA